MGHPGTSVLFVDDDVRVLEGLRRMLRGLRDEWHMVFTDSSQAALALLGEQGFDVVVTDLRMPGKDGVELLESVKVQHPRTVRLILSGHVDAQSILRAAGVAQQYLAKPCDAEVLKATITRAFALRSVLHDERLEQLVGRIDAIPSMPAAYRELRSCLESPRASLTDAGRIVARDPAMTVKVLQLVNSAYFGLARPITAVERAVPYLGIDTLLALVLGHGIFAECRPSVIPGFSFEHLWSRSLAVATTAKTLARQAGLDARAQEDAFLAGLLHDLGTLLLASEMPEHYAQVISRSGQAGTSRLACEIEVFNATHAEVGAYLIGLWGLPNSIVEAVAFHEEPGLAPSAGLSLAGIVHAAQGQVTAPDAGAEESVTHSITGRVTNADSIGNERVLTGMQT